MLRRLLGPNLGEGCLALRLLKRGPCDPPLLSNRAALIPDDGLPYALLFLFSSPHSRFGILPASSLQIVIVANPHPN